MGTGEAYLRTERCLIGVALALAITSVMLPAWGGEHAEVAGTVREESVREMVEKFAGMGSRTPGYPGNEDAARFIAEYFESLGIGDVYEQPLECAVPVEKFGRLELNDGSGASYDVHCMWPNRVRTPTLPPEGIDARIVYVGDGSLEEVDGVPLEGNIALVEYEAGRRWVTLADLGVRAFVFLPPSEDRLRREGPTVKILSVPINIPRLYVDERAAELRETVVSAGKSGIAARLTARMDWEKQTTRNVFLRIPGTDSELSSEYVVICGAYDSISIAPAVAPGAEQAANIAALLATAAALKDHPPKRSVILVATTGHYLALSGARKLAQDLVTYLGVKDGTGETDEHAEKVHELYSKLFQGMKRYFFLCLDLSSGNDAFGMFVVGTFFGRGSEWADWPRLKTAYDPFSEKVEERARLIEQELGLSEKVFVNGIKTERSVDYGIYFLNGVASDMEVIRTTTRNNSYFHGGVFFHTIQDWRPAYWSPRDVPEFVDFGMLTEQLRVLIPLLWDFTSGNHIPVDVYSSPPQSLKKVYGRVVWFNPRTSFVPDTPLEGAVVMHHPFSRSIAGSGEASSGTMTGGVLQVAYDMTDEQGRFSFDNFAKTTSQMEVGFWTVEAYALDKETGEIIYAPDRGVNGEERYPSLQFVIRNTDTSRQITSVLFGCVPTGVVGTIDPRYMEQLVGLSVIDGEMKTRPNAYGYTLPQSWPGTTSSAGDAAVVAFTKPGTRVSIAMGLGLIGQRLLVINSSDDDYAGHGYKAPEFGLIWPSRFLAVKDMWRLDDERMRQLARFGIRSENTESLHEHTEALLRKVEEERRQKHHEGFVADVNRAWAYESQVYADIKKVGDDTVRGVIFYMALLLPFSLFMERLLFGFSDIRLRVAAWVAIFLAVFLIFWAVHPAFRITITPYIIFLAFVLLALSGLVVILSASRFQVEIRKLRSQLVGIPEADVSRTAALVTAFALGVSYMRRRKVRTALTAATVVLVTFAILSFTSVRQSLRITKVPQHWDAPYDGFLLRNIAWQALNLEALERMESEFGDKFPVAPRSWYVKTAQSGVGADLVPILYREDREDVRAEANGALGLSAAEAEVTGAHETLVPGPSRWFSKGERGVCILPQPLADALEVSESDVGHLRIRMGGGTFLVIGVLDEEKFDTVKDIDDQQLTPVDYSSLSGSEVSTMRTAEDQTGQTGVAEYFHVSVSSLVLMPYEDVLAFQGSGAGNSGGSLRSVAVRFREDSEGFERAEEFIQQTALTGLLGKGGRSYVISSIGATSITGLKGVLPSMFLAILIVFNTMLGSVHERLNEIEIFNSVGLAPNHIAMLFMAEAAVFGVIGSVIGYLLGQTIAKLILWLNILPGLTLNYSSTSVVVTMLLVMGVVMASAIYPARMASSLAVPDIQRRWRLPPPKGDTWDFTFPFTIHLRESLGLNAFLMTYFEGMSGRDIGGSFTVKNVTFIGEKPEHFVLAADCWLAPYDLGVSQHVELHTMPSEEMPEYMELMLHAKRLSGEIGAWIRTNRPFLNDFRKQFLLWKTFPKLDRARFMKLGAERIGKAVEVDT